MIQKSTRKMRHLLNLPAKQQVAAVMARAVAVMEKAVNLPQGAIPKPLRLSLRWVVARINFFSKVTCLLTVFMQ